MKTLKNFKKYSPKAIDKKEIEDSINAIFLKSEDGSDWYECQSLFKEDTIKIMYDEWDVIRGINKDASLFYPEGRSVAELEAIPDEVSIDGNWQFIDNQVVLRVKSEQELMEESKRKKRNLLDGAEKAMGPLKDAIELKMATQNEKELYVAWQKYRVLVNRIETSQSDISWPSPPEIFQIY